MSGEAAPRAEDQQPALARSATGDDQPATDPTWSGVAARRRRAVSAGHRGDRAVAGAMLSDPQAPVRGAALGALSRAGGLSPAVLEQAMADTDPGIRRRACEQAGRKLAGAGDVDPHRARIVTMLMAMLDDPDSSVAEMAAWALGEAGSHGAAACDRLVSMTRSASPLCREAAVAALGAIGEPRGLDAVIDALADRPAVRRRAVVALAGFADRRARHALHRALEDRDWQTRQAAEDLLAD
ncbi:MAG TPA: HEAT repeat domain-containing protein [Acidimicrobiales bacterium]|nr:HEAT repeat domain-containing protein [Acidimicrobiales bacterium]